MPSFDLLWALLIGISHYEHLPVEWRQSLPGAQTDVENMQSFLTEELEVPKKNVLVLKNGQAKRADIISAFQNHLINNDDILSTAKGKAALLFYYAGHGGRVAAPSDWPVLETVTAEGRLEQKIEVLIPSDCKCVEGDDGRPSVQVIPDRTINALLLEAAKKHGQNITVILDCCFSAHLTRNKKVDVVSRMVPEQYLPPLLPETDSRIWGEENSAVAHQNEQVRGGISKKLQRPLGDAATRSHALLAACGRQQTAQEIISEPRGLYGGYFTYFLLGALSEAYQKHIDEGKRWPTYEEIMRDVQRRMQPSFEGLDSQYRQTPEASGWLLQRPLFQPFIDKRRFNTRLFRAGNNLRSKKKILVSAGHLHAIAHDTEFELYQDAQSETKVVARGIRPSGDITAAECILDIPDNIELPVFASVISSRTGHPLKVYISPEVKALEMFDDLKNVPITPEDTADLLIESDGKLGLRFTRRDRLLKGEWTKVLHIPENRLASIQDNMEQRLGIISLFNFHLYHEPSGSPRPYWQNVDVNFGAFQNETYADMMDKLDKTYCARTQNENGDYDVSVSPRAHNDAEPQQYGVVIQNNTPVSLFFYVVFFNPENYSVTIWYQPANDQTFVPPGATLQLGRSPELSEELVFEHAEGQEYDVGYMKVYMMPDYMDLSLINQEGLFVRIRRKDEIKALQDNGVGEEWDVARFRIISWDPRSDD